MKDDVLCVSIGGVLVTLLFRTTDWKTKKNLLRSSLCKYLHGFIVKIPLRKPTIYIHIIEIKGIPLIQQKGQYFCALYKQVSSDTYETYYHVNVVEFIQMLHLILVRQLEGQGIILHASGVLVKNKVCLFLGDSGAGKSTTLKMLYKTHQPIADDSIIVRKEGEAYCCYQTPAIDKMGWIDRSHNRFLLERFFFIHKDLPFQVKKLKPATLLTYLSRSLWVEKKIGTKTAAFCIEFVRNFGEGYSLRIKKNNGHDLISFFKP